MSFTPSGNSILVDTPESVGTAISLNKQSAGSQLAGWVGTRVQQWEDHRNRGYSRLWSEYWRMWRGKWSEEDRNRLSERSRIIAPALAQAIEMSVSEVEEAVFSKEVWFDIADDIQDENKIDALQARDYLLEDMDRVNAKDAISEAVLNAAIFGTGIVKINTQIEHDLHPRRDSATFKLSADGKERVFVTVESVRPDEFIPDPSGKSIQDMLGAAHRVKKPLHAVLEKIEAGTYRRDALPLLSGSPQGNDGNQVDFAIDPQANSKAGTSDEVDIIEYHGKVPLKLLNATYEKKSDLDNIIEIDVAEDSGEGPLIEAIVTIANGGILLRAIANPFVMTDRCFVTFQWEKVPGRFWGRGVAEKGYNPQKALDAGVRSWIDALGYVSSPMLGIDSGRIPKGMKLEVKPGKAWLTNGNPNEVLFPLSLGDLNPALFTHATEMERMVQMGTGAFDTATSLKNQSQSGASSLSSNSMMMGAFVKRSKRAIQNIDRNMLAPLIEKVMWRYMQFYPTRYPRDYDFRVKATLGIMAREVELAQQSQIMGMLGEEVPGVKLTLMQGMVENMSVTNKAQIIQAINQAMQPPPPEQVEKQKQLADLQFQAALAQAQGTLLANQKTIAEIRKLLAEAQKFSHQAGVEDDKVLIETEKVRVMREELETYEQQNALQLRKLSQQDRALDIKEEELEIKRKQASKPTAS